jgi:hypothetical protein
MRRVGANIALAGSQLFDAVFQPFDGSERVRALAKQLETVSRRSPLAITIMSESLFLPWGLMYVHPTDEGLATDGSNWDPRGFWGARHAIEHRVPEADSSYQLTRRGGKLEIGVNVDMSLDNGGPLVVNTMLQFFTQHSDIDLKVRTTRDELRNAMSDPAYSDQIVYFCCHGRVNGSSTRSGDVNMGVATMSLTDRDSFDVIDMQQWLKRRPLDSHPVVFLNSCQGGQMVSLFYHSFAAELLRRRANCVVGAHVDVPLVFAPKYAEEFFQRFLRGHMRVAEIVRDLAWTFLDTYNNPLGLIFASYRGLDTYYDPSAF